MEIDVYSKLISFLNRLEECKISYTIGHSREDAVIVIADVPGERWDIEFMLDGSVEIERFVSTGEIEDESSIEGFFNKYSD